MERLIKLLRIKKNVAIISAISLTAVGVGLFALQSQATAYTVGSDGALFFFDGNGVLSDGPQTTHQWGDELYGSASSSAIDSQLACPSTSTATMTFISDRGSERSKAAWKAFASGGFYFSSKNVLEPNMSPESNVDGGVPGQAVIKAIGGNYSMGIACLSNALQTVDKVLFRNITVSAGGAWTALENDPSNVVGASPTSSPTASASPTASPTSSPTASPTSTPLPTETPAVYPPVNPPAWASNAVYYGMNIRNFTKAGTLDAAKASFARLKTLGVNTLVLDPIFPIATQNKLGLLGSVFATADLKSVNGSLLNSQSNAFGNFVSDAHKAGFKVVIDWVADRTGQDALWVDTHKSWYTQDSNGNLTPSPLHPDTYSLNYTGADASALKTAMISAMKFWVSTYDIDGFNCVDAGLVPLTFWDQATYELNTVKQLMFISTSETSPIAQAHSFASNFNTDLFNTLNSFANGKIKATVLASSLVGEANSYGGSVPTYGITYLDGYFESAKLGTSAQRFGSLRNSITAMSILAPGSVFIYNGQEFGSTKALSSYSKDSVSVNSKAPMLSLIQKLLTLKKKNSALSNQAGTSTFTLISSSAKSLVFSRQSGSAKVIYLANLGSKAASISVGSTSGSFFDVLNGNKVVKVANNSKLNLAPYGFAVLSTVAAK